MIIQYTNVLYLLWYYFNLVRFFTCTFIRTAGKKTHDFKVENFMNNLKNIEFLTFLYMFRSFRPSFITVSTENYRGMAHIMEKNSETDKSCTMTSILRICFYYS